MLKTISKLFHEILTSDESQKSRKYLVKLSRHKDSNATSQKDLAPFLRENVSTLVLTVVVEAIACIPEP